ncbi:hypothetical protein PYW07_012631 [Mythimna separata]|uniref:Uncharacterized protein n=1 Tax=Mythimna separata TaxID=271217 RepID=A0AAD8DLK6_MYTSE|nr:hypothetical protein PYW07_012631 [Mythimna separata]
MGKLLMCRICLVENVRMCVVTDKSLQEMYEKLTDVPFVTEDRKPMLACLFCCTRLKQCCQLQRKCVEAEELLAQMLSEDYEEKPLTNHGQLGFVVGLIKTPVENISIVDDSQVVSDAVKQELPAVCEEQDDVELQLTHLSEELEPENLYNSHPDVEAHHSESESEEEQLVMDFKIEEEEEHELSDVTLRFSDSSCSSWETKKPELTNPDKGDPSVEDKPAHESESDPEDDVLLMDMKTKAEEGQGVSKRKRRACGTRGAVFATKSILRRKLEDTIPAKQRMNLPSDSKITRRSRTKTGVVKKPTVKRKLEDTSPAEGPMKIIRKTETSKSKSVAKIKEPITVMSQSSQSTNIIKHTQIHTDEKPFTCDICQRSFHAKCNLKTHFRIHSGAKPYKCDICQRSFSHKGNFNSHFRTHTVEKRYECDVCKRSFRLKKYLALHFRKHSGEKPFKCIVCQRSFSHKSSLNVHSRIHTGAKPYQCDVCQRSFVRKSSLTEHFRKHTGEKPFQCDICQSSLSNKSSLHEHFRIHTGEKPYKCNVCQRSFISKGKLTVHFRKHSGEKPFKCDICQRSYNLKSTLNKHVRNHTGEKPYKCYVCQRSFNDKGALTVHSRLHTGERPYQCNVCQRNFTCKGKLTVHFRKHSGANPFRPAAD